MVLTRLYGPVNGLLCGLLFLGLLRNPFLSRFLSRSDKAAISGCPTPLQEGFRPQLFSVFTGLLPGAANAAHGPARGTAGGTGRGFGCLMGRSLATGLESVGTLPQGMGVEGGCGERSEGGNNGRTGAAGVFGDAVTFVGSAKTSAGIKPLRRGASGGIWFARLRRLGSRRFSGHEGFSVIARLTAAGIGVTQGERSEALDSSRMAWLGVAVGVGLRACERLVSGRSPARMDGRPFGLVKGPVGAVERAGRRAVSASAGPPACCLLIKARISDHA